MMRILCKCFKPHWWKKYQQIHQNKTVPKDLNKLGEIDAARYGFANTTHMEKGDAAKFNDWYGGNLDDQGLLTMNRYVQGYEGIDKLFGGQTLLNPRGLAPGIGHKTGGYSLTEPQLLKVLDHFARKNPIMGKGYREGFGSHNQDNTALLLKVLNKFRKGEDITEDIVKLQNVTGKGTHAPQLLGSRHAYGQESTFADPLMSWTGDMSSAEKWLNQNKWIVNNEQPIYQIQSKFDPNSIFRAGRMEGRNFNKGKFDLGESEWTSVGKLDKRIVPELKGTEGFTARKVATPNWRQGWPGQEAGGLDPFQDVFTFTDDIAENIFPKTAFNKIGAAKSELKELGKLNKASPIVKNKMARLEKNIAELTKDIAGKKGKTSISDKLFDQLLQKDPNLLGMPMFKR